MILVIQVHVHVTVISSIMHVTLSFLFYTIQFLMQCVTHLDKHDKSLNVTGNYSRLHVLGPMRKASIQPASIQPTKIQNRISVCLTQFCLPSFMQKSGTKQTILFQFPVGIQYPCILDTCT